MKYIAYGSNMVQEQMAFRCPDARLMRALIQLAADSGMIWMTLEVRRSNAAAQGLYRKLGFVDVGWRKRYYEDNGEDALLMGLEHLPEGHPENDPFAVFEEE